MQKMGYPSLSKLANVYGDTTYNGDFMALKKIPKFNALSTLSATLSLKWPDVTTMYSTSGNKPMPKWISVNRKRRGIFESMASFFQLSMSNEIPLITFANLESCTQACQNATLLGKVKRPLEASIQSKFGDLKTRFVGFNLENQFAVPFKLNLPKTSVCLPFLDVCSGKLFTFFTDKF
jgi:hypothetical protein